MKLIYINLINYFISIACFLSIYLCHKILISGDDHTLIIAAFGASAVLTFSNDTIKHSFIKICSSSIIAAIIGVFWNQIDIALIFKITITISSCILIMNLLNISYPPAGAIAVIPLISNAQIQDLGYLYVVYPTMTGLLIIYSFSIIKEKFKKKLLWQVKKQLKS
ncbi:HPP family protein [Aquimarina aquimarini]|uniref:HPP family protein n=1 Tax=Aquimarina aquimarini TaxID=1191734 RepID=UPI000D54B48E|nr:HPP family protein [Aquimarina aquimarini]